MARPKPDHDGHLRQYGGPRKSVSVAFRLTDDPRYIEKTIHRLAILEDVPSLRTPQQIRKALQRWKHCLFAAQAEVLEAWLSART